MKKALSLIAAAAVALGVNAQIESAVVDYAELGLTSEAAPMAEGTVLCKSENITMMLAYEDNVKTQTNKSNDCTYAWINGEPYNANTSMTGSSNPQGASLTDLGASAPISGFVFQFKVAKTGYIVCFSKLSSNKNYWVFEGLAGQEEQAVAYTAGIIWDAGDGEKAHLIEMPADEMGYIDLNAADIETYWNPATGFTKQLRQIITGDMDTSLTGNGFGFLAFPVYADAENYLMCAQGSKMSCGGFFFIPSDDNDDAELARPTALGAGVADAMLYKWYGEGEVTGINGVAVDNNSNGQMFNVLGQPVDNGYKGLVIKNGKKYINR